VEAPPEAPAEATAAVEADDAETPEGTESPAPAMGGGAGEEPEPPTPTAVPPGTATALPDEVAARSVEEEAPEATEGAEEPPEREVPARATIPPQRVLEAILGLTALGLALATVWAWRARRR
jgi:hypothetical protein